MMWSPSARYEAVKTLVTFLAHLPAISKVRDPVGNVWVATALYGQLHRPGLPEGWESNWLHPDYAVNELGAFSRKEPHVVWEVVR